MAKAFRRYLRLIILTVPAVGVAALFQNCGQTNFDTSLIEVPARSPYYEKRVRVDDPEAVRQKAIAAGKVQAPPQQLNLLVNNPCAAIACEKDPDALVCRLRTQSLRPELENSLQAYRYNPATPLTPAEIEDLINFSHANDRCVIGVADERAYRTSQVFSDPNAAGQWHHQVLGSPAAVEFLRTLPRPTTGNLVVGMVDSGVQYNHEDLSGVPISNINFSSSCTTICNFHGTAVAGVIAASMNNNKGGAGLFTGSFLLYSAQVGNADGVITTSELVNGMTFLRNVNVEVINLSLGGFNVSDFSLQDAMERAAAANINVIVAAGNVKRNLDEASYYPASFQVNGQINVASASPKDIPMSGQTSAPSAAQIASAIELDEYSNFSPAQVHIAAPGKAIRTLALDNGYSIASGTSFAAPMVTAAAIWVRHYAKAAGLKISARQVKELVLASSVPQAALEGKVQTQRYLSFTALKQELQALATSAQPLLGAISLVSSEVIGSGASAVVRVTVGITNANASTGWTMRAYTNPDFLAETNTGQSCRIVSNTTCTFDISTSSMLVDPGVYLEIKDDSGKLISDKMIGKTSLNFGDRSTAALKGAVIGVTARGKDMLVEGWACLTGFPDQLPIEVRVNSATGTPVDVIPASRWARGDYFAACSSAEVRLGFRYVVPPNLINGTARTLYFRATTPDGSRGFDLPVYSYQPGYMDATPAQTVASVYIDPYLADETPTVRFTSVTFNDFVLNVSGTACFTNSRKPVALALGLNFEDVFDMIPETRLPLNRAVASPDGGTNATYEIRSKGTTINYANTSPRAVDDAGMMFRYSPPFNDDTDEYNFVAPGPVGTSNRLVRMGADTFSSFGLITLAPTSVSGDGCAFPSGFSASYDVRQVMKSISASISVSWRPDMISDIDAILATRSIPAPFVAILNSPSSSRTIGQLPWSPRGLSVSYAVVGAPKQIGAVTTTVDGFMDYFKFSGIAAGANTPSNQAASSESSQFLSEDSGSTPSGSIISGDGYTVLPPAAAAYSGSRLMGRAFPLHAKLWADTTSTNVQVANATTYSVVKAPWTVTLGTTAARRMIVGLKYQNAPATPVPRDLILEFQINGAGTWYQAPVAKHGDITGMISNSTLTGYLVGDVDLPAPATSLKIRLKAKGTQQFTLSRLGVLAE